jgi:hypothetical protein
VVGGGSGVQLKGGIAAEMFLRGREPPKFVLIFVLE